MGDTTEIVGQSWQCIKWYSFGASDWQNLATKEVRSCITLIDYLTFLKPMSRGEAKRIILQGGFRINGVKMNYDNNALVEIKDGDYIEIGKLNKYKIDFSLQT